MPAGFPPLPGEVIVVNNSSTLFSVPSLQQFPYKSALRDNVNVAITLYRGESWTASRAAAPVVVSRDSLRTRNATVT